MRRRILLLVVGMTTLVVLAFAIPLAVLTHNVIGQQAEKSIQDQARSVAAYLRSAQPGSGDVTAYLRQQTLSSGYPISVRMPDGELVGSTPGDPERNRGDDGSLSNGPRPPAGGQGGKGGPGGDHEAPPQITGAPGGSVAIAVAPAPGGFYQVRVYLSDSKRYEGTTQWYLLIIGASL